MTRKNLIAEILTELKNLDESGLIDYRSLNRWIKNEIKRFGSNLCILTEKVLHVQNGEADLPDNFYNLEMAVICEPHSHEFIQGCKTDLQSSQFWTEKLETTYTWDNQSQSHFATDFKAIEERINYNNCSMTMRYHNPQPLKLVKGIKREFCANSCQNFRFYNCPNEMNIIQNKAHFNFKCGTVYMTYYGLPTDEDGDLYIPDLVALEKYLIAYCKRNIMANVWMNDDDVNVVNKLNYLKQEERELFSLAMTEVKFSALSKDWYKKIQYKNKRDTLRYEHLFPNH